MKNKTVLIIIGLYVLPGLLLGQMMADITEDVQTDFGIYRSYPVTFNPNVSAFSVAADFSNVENYQNLSYLFTETDEDLLLANHFTVKYSRYKQLYDIYNECTWDGTPVFVTTDAVLHIYHVLFDQMLADIEVQEFVETLKALTRTLLSEAESEYAQSNDGAVKEAIRRNMAFLGVAKKLLEGENVTVPESVTALVDSELVLIEAHEGYRISPIFGAFSALDYSHYLPRGHYTKSDTLKAFFKAMMWYGLTIFTMEPDEFGNLARRHTLQALMLTQMVYRLQYEGQALFDLWEYIYEPTAFFVGRTDDPNIEDYKTIAETIYGTNFLSIPPDELNDGQLLDDFMTEAQELPEPAIPNWIHGSFTTYKGFRFMGQRFIPDSYMFAYLVLPEIDGRYFPMGLDVMAILGSGRAYTILDLVYGETGYVGYPEKITQFRNEFSSLSSDEWAQNLYWNWLYCLMPLLYLKGEGYPFFMQTTAWADKELLTALASWAELRHDTILYAKQSSTPCCLPPGPPRSYVEPNPYLYARLASLVRYTREGLESFGLLLEAYREKLNLFENLLLFLRDVSVKELENTPLSDAEYEDIYCFGKVMRNLVSKSGDPQNPAESDVDDMAIIADVHTDSNTDQCLEEGVGYPLEVYVIVNEGGIPRITRGAMFSYYEFLQPITDRLTDEEWRDMLTGDTPPVMPRWVDSFMDVQSPRDELLNMSPDNLFEKDFVPVENPMPNGRPANTVLFPNYPNPFNPETTIRFDLSRTGQITLSVFNLLGQKVKVLIDGIHPTGNYSIQWDGRDDSGRVLPSGVYIVKLVSGEGIRTRKMFLHR